MVQWTDRGFVYLVTQEDLSEGRSTAEIVRAAIKGGVDVVQLREKNRSSRDRYHLGTNIREITAEAGVTFIVNDRVDIALAVGADGVHLGASDMPVAIARELLGANAVIGRSVSSNKEAAEAIAAGADYLGVGSIYPTDSKQMADHEAAIGLETIRAIRSSTDIPIVGIGGITAVNAAAVISAGANGVAVISAISAADDPERATQQLCDAAIDGVVDQ